MNNDIDYVLYSEDLLYETVNKLGKQISDDYKDRNLLMVSILKGSVCFMSDLMRRVRVPCEIDFMAVSSYGKGTKTSGTVRIIKDLDRDIRGYDVLLVEDILDSGKTLNYLMDMLYGRNPNSIRIATLFDKPDRREVDIKADYKGIEVPDKFIVGYGLDFDEKYRNLPYVGVLKREIYEKN